MKTGMSRLANSAIPIALASVLGLSAETNARAGEIPTRAPLTDREAIVEAATTIASLMGRTCNFIGLASTAPDQHNRLYRISYRFAGQDEDSPDEGVELVQLLCFTQSNNSEFVYLTKDYGEDQFTPVAFAEPEASYDYTDESFSALKNPPAVTGFRTTFELSNASFDPTSKTVRSLKKWRGSNDAWSAGEWQFQDDHFVLRKFEVDPTYVQGNDNHNAKKPQSFILYQAADSKN
jgi:hypothetical protein